MTLFCAAIKKIQLLSKGFPFIAMSRFSRASFRQYFFIIIIIIIYSSEFFTSELVDGLSLKFEWEQVSSSLHDSSQFSGLLNNIVVWMVSTRPSTSKSSSPFSNPLVTFLNASITIDIIVTWMFHRHHHHVVPPARISLTLSCHFSLSFIASGRPSGVHPVSLQSCCM